jgi:hypothetical protein
MGARMPLCSMTMRAAIGCSRGAEVVPGTCAAATISSQMSSGPRMCSRHWRKGRPSRVGDQLARRVADELPRSSS